jgi:hypothetical protein
MVEVVLRFGKHIFNGHPIWGIDLFTDGGGGKCLSRIGKDKII